MSETVTTKPVNLYQLGQEIGGGPALRMTDDGTTRKVRSDVAQATLDVKVKAHVADPTIVPPPDPAEVQDDADDWALRQQVASRLPKARAILADPASAPDWTANERKVILALTLLDLARRHR